MAGHTRDHCESWSKCRELLAAFHLSPNMRPLQNEVDLRASVQAYVIDENLDFKSGLDLIEPRS